MAGLLRRIFGGVIKNPSTSETKPDPTQEQRLVFEAGRRLVEVINESIQFATNSNDINTKISRLNVAKATLIRAKALATQYPYISLTSLPEVELTIEKLEEQFNLRDYKQVADDNERGNQLEREGKISEAISLYEGMVALGVDTPFTYRRLAILHRKSKDQKREIESLLAALKNIPKENAAHYGWFEDRLKKIKGRIR